MRETDDDDDDHKSAPPFATLVAASDEAREVLHVDRTSEECNRVGTKRCALIGPNVELRFSNAVVGRILMAKDNVTRAKMQTADLALDLPSGTFGFFFFAFVRAFARRSWKMPRHFCKRSFFLSPSKKESAHISRMPSASKRKGCRWFFCRPRNAHKRLPSS